MKHMKRKEINVSEDVNSGENEETFNIRGKSYIPVERGDSKIQKYCMLGYTNDHLR